MVIDVDIKAVSPANLVATWTISQHSPYSYCLSTGFSSYSWFNARSWTIILVLPSELLPPSSSLP